MTAFRDAHRRGRSSFFLLFLLVVLLSSPAQALPPAEFDTITFADGLVSSSVSSITQDDAGFLWFGTQAGVQRYDGYGMQLYTAEPFKPDSLSNQLVQTMYLGPDNVLWVGTYSGLNRLDLRTRRIVTFPHTAEDVSTLSNNIVTSIRHDAAGSLWVATLDGLNRMDDEGEGRFTRYAVDPEDPESLPHHTVRALLRDSRDRLWVGSLGGISLVMEDAGGEVRFRTWDDDGPDGESLPSPYVMTIAEDDMGYLWIGTWDGGVSRFDPAEGTFVHYELADLRLYTVMVATTGLVYAGTWGGGLHVIDPRAGTIETYRHDPELSGSLAHDVVYSLYEDGSGIIWIGTNGNGINLFDPRRESFRYVHQELPREKRIDSGKVQALWLDPESGDLYVGLQNRGLNVVDGDTGIVTRYSHDRDDPASISSDTVNDLLPDRDGTILVSTHNGLNRFYPPRERGGRGRFSPVTEPEIPDPIIYPVIRDRREDLWIGTYNSGVFRYGRDGTLRQYAHDPQDRRTIANNLVYDILEDRYGTIWVATNGGLHRYRSDTDDFDRFVYDPANPRGISGLSVGNIYEDRAGTLWIGTRSGGLNRFERETETFSHFTSRQGMTSNAVVSLHEGEPGLLYVATPNGLNLVFTGEDRVVPVDERDGLDVREFSTGITREPGGALLLGAFSEVVRVASRSTDHEGMPPRTVITGTAVLDTPLGIASEYRDATVLELSHQENFLEFSFSVLSFSLPGRNTYRYQLRGFDGNWVDAGTRNHATYTNVPPGNYEFLVVGTDAYGLSSVEPARMIVRIRPPFWATAWFIALAVVMTFLVVLAAYLLRVRSLHRINRLLEETVAERTARLSEANEVKDQFFSIIAHDLRGPVAGMESLTRQAVLDYETYTPELLRDIFSTIHNSAAALLGMLENLLEWARVQSGRIEFNPHREPLAPILNALAEANSVTAQAKSITLHVECDRALTIHADLDMTRAILQNLVNNAIKFTPPGGEVFLIGQEAQHPEEVELIVRDTGVGVPEEKIGELFLLDRRYRTTGTAGERGSGFGLSLCRDLVQRQQGELRFSSKTGQGTTVKVTLPR